MSAEHKALGYRPPPGSLAATAQAEAAKHPQAGSGLSDQLLLQAAIEDAARVQEQRSTTGVDLSTVDEGQFSFTCRYHFEMLTNAFSEPSMPLGMLAPLDVVGAVGAG